ncbi:unnamed protein product [Lampetra fluviatilis]
MAIDRWCPLQGSPKCPKSHSRAPSRESAPITATYLPSAPRRRDGRREEEEERGAGSCWNCGRVQVVVVEGVGGRGGGGGGWGEGCEFNRMRVVDTARPQGTCHVLVTGSTARGGGEGE